MGTWYVVRLGYLAEGDISEWTNQWMYIHYRCFWRDLGEDWTTSNCALSRHPQDDVHDHQVCQ